MIANKRTEESDAIKHTERNYIKAITIELENLVRTVKEPEIQNKVEKVYDAMKSSPTKSDDSVVAVENEIRGEIGRLRNLITSVESDQIDSIVERLLGLINKRNSQLRLLN